MTIYKLIKYFIRKDRYNFNVNHLKEEKMKKVFTAFFISSLFAVSSMAVWTKTSNSSSLSKKQIQQLAWYEYLYARKCGYSESLDAKLCRLKNNLRVK